MGLARRDAMTRPDERREWLRIDDRVLLEYWRAGESEASVMSDGGASPQAVISDEAIAACIRQPTQHLMADMPSLESDARLLPWLMKVDWVMEMVLKTLARMTPGGLALPQPTDVMIGGGGISFESARRFAEGEQLELRMILPPFTPIRTVAEVIRVTPVPGQAHRYTVATAFTVIAPDDQERLVRHILHRQAERLRARHV